jgi:putative endopeptidase
MNRKLAVALAVIAFSGCSPSATREPSATAENYLATFVDPSVDPRQDFYQYSVGKWLKDNPIPASERSWGIGKVVQEESYRRLVALSEAAAADRKAAPGSNTQKIGDFWHAAMDSAAIDAAGMKPLADQFAMIDAAADRDALLGVIAKLQHMGVGALFATYIFQDEKDSERYSLHLYQGGLGLPSREYYFDTDERTTKVRSEYVPHVKRMFELLGDDSVRARARAETVMAIETEMARSSRKLEDLRDPHKNYNAMALSGVERLAPSIRWREFFEQGKIGAVDTVVVGQPEFFRQIEKLLQGRTLDEWKTYLRWHLASAFAEQAGGAFDAENFRFYGTILNGTAEQRPRWKRMLDSQENYLGYALGQLYVERYFSPRTRERYVRLTDEIFEAFRGRVDKLEWMSAATKERALRKLDAVTKKIGYPDKWRDYSTYEVNRESFLGNCKRGNEWLSDFYIEKLRKPVDRTEWEMTPQTYNAYYNPSNNEIVMPAAIFILPGIADSLADDALVYAYAGGTTIGHEITHGFDDTGRQFDERGNLVSWWTPEDEKEFNRRAQGIIRQYDAYVAVDSLRVNGTATQGENIADLGGIELGWDAFTKTQQYKEGKPIGGLTPAQRYFVGWSLGWMNQLRPENLAMRVKTDVHAPSFLRVTGPVTNLPQFYEAFGVQPGDPMHRADSVRVHIW